MRKPTGIVLLGLTFVVLLSSSQLVQSQLAESPWPKFQHDLRNTGRSQYRGPQDNKLQWVYSENISGSVVTFPTISSYGAIYFGVYNVYTDTENKFYALNPDGSVKWTSVIRGWTEVPPAIASDGTIYVGFRHLFYGLSALNPDGSEIWSFQTGDWGAVLSSPAIAADGTIYFGSYDNKFYALNPDGSEKWSFPTGWRIASSPSIGSDGTIYFGSNDNKFYALNPDGSEKWSFPTNDIVCSSPAIGADGTIYIASEDGNLYALYENGSLKWSYPVGYSGLSPAIAADGTIYIGAYDNKLDGYLHALRDDGDYATLKWSFPVAWLPRPTPIVDNEGTIYFGSNDTIYALNPDNTVKWTFTVGGAFFDSPLVISANGTIYARSFDSLYAIGTPGEQPEEPSEGNEEEAPPDNTPLIAGATGAVFVLLAIIFWLHRRSVKPVV